MSNNSITTHVREKYAAVAGSTLSGDHDGVQEIAAAFGYSPDELATLPPEANMGLSCGNPVATANLRPGEVVVDLGAGGGIDVLLASRKVGPSGRAIGIDMTPEMVERARRNAVKMGGGTAPANVEFHLATIDRLPLESGSVDCLISNCVINLAPDKPAVFREMFRVLKPGGRVALSDIALKKPLPAEIGADLLAYVGCIAGAVLAVDYERMLREAGFDSVEVIDTRKDLNAYTLAGASGCCSPAMSGSLEREPSCCETAPAGLASCCAPETAASPADRAPATADLHGELAELFRKYNVNDYAASVQVYAVKSSAAAP